MDNVEKAVLVVIVMLAGLIVGGLFASADFSDQYKQACVERNGVTVYNGKHYECFVKG